MSSNGATGGKMNGAGDPGAMGGTGCQSLKKTEKGLGRSGRHAAPGPDQENLSNILARLLTLNHLK